jgi:protein ImuB
MTRLQAESFGIPLFPRNRAVEGTAFAGLLRCMERYSPRIEAIASPQEERCGATFILDVSGSERLLGNAQNMASSMLRAVQALGFEASVVACRNARVALLAARGLRGATAIEQGGEAAALAPLPLSVVEPDLEQAQTFADWGIHTLEQLAALPTKSLVARMGQRGLHMQRQARGEYSHLLVPEESPANAPICEEMQLEHPVEVLESLFFLLNQMLEKVLLRAAERALAIASVETCLRMERPCLDASHAQEDSYEHRRVVRPALPERERLTLLKLIQLDLELHPPEAAVIGLRLTAFPARAQSAQHGLFAAQAPEAGRMEILLARLRKLVGEGRIGAPELLDTHGPQDFRVVAFTPPAAPSTKRDRLQHTSALRMIRPPRAVTVEMREHAPDAIHYEGRRRHLRIRSGPWRTSGAWWTSPAWNREEWDVVVEEQPHRCMRLAFDPDAHCWYVIGVYD